MESGGHDIPRETIIRRYKKGLENFFSLYLPFVDRWALYNNSKSFPILIAEKLINQAEDIYDNELWGKLK